MPGGVTFEKREFSGRNLAILAGAALAAVYVQKRFDALDYVKDAWYATAGTPATQDQAATTLANLETIYTRAQTAGRTGLAGFTNRVAQGIVQRYPALSGIATAAPTAPSTGGGTQTSATGGGATSSGGGGRAPLTNLQSVDIMYSSSAGYRFTTSMSYKVAVQTGVANVTGVALPTDVQQAATALQRLYALYRTPGVPGTAKGRVVIVEINWIKKHYPGAVKAA